MTCIGVAECAVEGVGGYSVSVAGKLRSAAPAGARCSFGGAEQLAADALLSLALVDDQGDHARPPAGPLEVGDDVHGECPGDYGVGRRDEHVTCRVAKPRGEPVAELRELSWS